MFFLILTDTLISDHYILSSLCRGAQVMISSTLRIISAASVADSNTACLTLNASEIPSSDISPTCRNFNIDLQSDESLSPHLRSLDNVKKV